MDPTRIRDLLERVRANRLGVDEALQELRHLPYRDLGFANVDHHRHLRTGFPEVIFGEGKSAEQIAAILREVARGGANCLVTRVAPEKARAVLRLVSGSAYDEVARAVTLVQRPIEDRGRGPVVVVSAGTSDIPVAEEAALTAHLMGNRVERLFDVGVAGIHRLLGRREMIDRAEVLVVAAGMEGALASVVGGLVDRPVIAVPTSVGYGASFNGIAALLGMLNSCAAGVTVVNIDNGFGAGYVAALINRRTEAGAARAEAPPAPQAAAPRAAAGRPTARKRGGRK
ncbi:MAG: nickel pincer cofactor biosynthesis protein LarB [Deltaproteobacteria bacterium]|nr:nickel pincer cofactor biosynthesis protein LarB [Deltaproteobacteria bacterium]